MPTPKVEFELESNLPPDVRNNALEFTDRWRGFEPEVFRLILKLTGTSWRLTKLRVRFQSNPTPETETAETRATVVINAGTGWKLEDYLSAVARELIMINQREKVRRQLKSQLDVAAFRLLADLYSKTLLARLSPGSTADFRPSVARFLSLALPSKYPDASRDRLLERAPKVRSLADEIVNEFPADSGGFLDAFLRLSDRLSSELTLLLSPNI